MEAPVISKNISIEDLIDNYSFAADYLMHKGIRCIRCGEAIWGNLEEACKEKGFGEDELNSFIDEMNEIAHPTADNTN